MEKVTGIPVEDMTSDEDAAEDGAGKAVATVASGED